jgi:hypothetical protein
MLHVFRLKIIQNLDEAAIIVLFTLMVIRRLARKEKFFGSPIDMPVIALILLGFASSITNRIVSFQTTIGGAVLFVKGFLLFYIFAYSDFKEKHLKYYMKGFLIVGFIVMLYGVLAVIWPNAFLVKLGYLPNTTSFGFAAMQSVFGHPGAFGAFMAILGCYSMAAFLVTGKRKYAILIAVFMVGIIFSFRRTSLFGFVLVTLMAISKWPAQVSAKKIAKKNAIAILLIILLLFSGFVMTIYKDLYKNYITAGETPRSILFKTGVKIAVDNFPLGSGFGTFGSGINRADYSPLYYKYGLSNIWGFTPDSPSFINDTFWPHVMAETGFFGILLYISVIFGFFKILRESFHLKTSQIVSIFAFGAFLVFTESLIESLKATFYETSLWTYFYFGSLGILWSFVKQGSGEHDLKVGGANRESNENSGS